MRVDSSKRTNAAEVLGPPADQVDEKSLGRPLPYGRPQSLRVAFIKQPASGDVRSFPPFLNRPPDRRTSKQISLISGPSAGRNRVLSRSFPDRK